MHSFIIISVNIKQQEGKEEGHSLPSLPLAMLFLIKELNDISNAVQISFLKNGNHQVVEFLGGSGRYNVLCDYMFLGL